MSFDSSRSRSAMSLDSTFRTRTADISLTAYSQAELQVLREIISASINANDSASFLTVFKAYDSVLKAHNIDPATDRIYFKFLLKLARVQGSSWVQKFDNLLAELDINSPRHPHQRPSSSQPSLAPQRLYQNQALSTARTSSEAGPRHATRPRSVIEIDRTRNDSSSQRISLHANPEFAISFEQDPRKYAILRQFWHAWRAKTMRRHSRLNSQIEIADRHYRMILLPLTLETWKQKWRYFAILQRRVERDRIRIILARCFNWWLYRNRLILKQNDCIHNEVAMRRTFKAWLAQARVRQQELSSLTLSNVMERWKAKASTTRDLYAMAEQWSRRHVLRQFWKEWFFRTCSAKTVQYYQIKLLRRALGQWISRSRRFQNMKRHALYRSRKSITVASWTRWRTATHEVSTQEEIADRLWRHRMLSVGLATWQRNQQLSLRASLLGDQMDNQLTSRAWKRWRETTKITIDADTKADWNLLRNAFKGWRDDAMATKLETHIDRCIIARSFSYWMVRQRGRLLERVRDQRFLYEALEIWREQFQGIREALDSTSQIIEQTRATKVLRSSFQMWRETFAYRAQENDLAAVCHERSLMRKSLKFWISSFETHKRLTSEATHALYYFLARRSLMKWHNKSILTRKQRRQQVLDNHLQRRSRKMVTQCFAHWRRETKDCLDLQEIADQIQDEKDLDLIQDSFANWGERFRSVLKLKSDAMHFHYRQLLRDHFDEWRASVLRIRQVEDILDDFIIVHNQEVESRHLRLWRMRLFQLRGPAMQADMFKHRSQRLKLRLILRIWRDKTHTQKVLDDTTKSSTIEGLDRAHTAPITPKRSTRRFLWRNLNSR